MDTTNENNDKNKVEEPLGEYIVKKKLGSIFKSITPSNFVDMENRTRQYSELLSFTQRMEYLHDLNNMVFTHVINNTPHEILWSKVLKPKIW